ncbi:hypothetical protein CH92_01635 [Stutzerimonas stutzeri]|uniref:Extensin family protein n=1 Tax=Stutzerimonas stutzeri TaxID=316 RepID=W8RPB2_STUST|nr:hypothetical protein [Stutzerimonas stutzeri]AHL73861.1 hypothetical protein CH92_01635 [Stutzerimonas stutzeri]MCQ4328617.1 hypothetical protein [Stutzerimonas stutzeri]
MDLRFPIFAASLVLASAALATGTGPTLPEKSREHPLDNREPQDVIERPDADSRQPRPPTLEAPPAIEPVEPIERRSPSERPERRDTGAGANLAPAN